MISFLQQIKQRWHIEGGYRELLIIAFPLVLSTGAWALQHFFDRMFLTWYSAKVLAAAMPAGVLNFTIMGFFFGTAGYTSTFVAQYFGAGRYHRIGPVLWQGAYIAVIAAVTHLILIPLAGPFFNLIGHEPVVADLEAAYFRMLCLGVGPAVGSMAFSSFYSGRGKAWPIVWVNLSATCVNMIFNYIMIFGHLGFPEMGIAGAGLATVISGLFSLCVYLVIICRKENNRTFHTLSGWRPDKELFSRLLRFGLPNGIPFLVEHMCFAAFTLLVGRLGTLELAATNLAFNIESLGFLPMLGFGMAVSVLVGQKVGKNRPDLAEQCVYSGFSITFIYMLFVVTALISIPNILFWPFLVNADAVSMVPVVGIAGVLLRFVAVFSLFDTVYVIFSSGIRGAGDTQFSMFMVVGLSIFALALPSYVTLGVFNFGLYTAWGVVTGYIMLMSMAFLVRFRGGKWKTMRVIET